MNKIKQLVGKGKNALENVVTYWNKPAKGEYVSYKEIINYSVGGMGQNMVLYLLGFFGFGISNLLIASAIGIRPIHIQNMATIMTIVQVVMAIVRGKLVDNTRTKWGRFRPYIALGSIPIVVLAAIFLFLNFDLMSYNQKLGIVFAFGMSIQVIQPLFVDSYTELRTVISPNSKERAKVITLSAIIYSIAPTIYNLFIPMLSDFTGGFTNINTYKFVVLPVGVLGVFMSLFAAFGCKERVVSAVNYVQKSNIFHDIMEVWRNKYWWIRNIAGLVGVLEGAYLVIFGWIFIYDTQNMTSYGLFNTVLGTASLISMAITPFLLKKLGNKRIMIFHNLINIVFIAFMCFTFTNWVIFFILYYLNTVANQLVIVYDPAIHSEVKDYQQYISDKRMDFTFGAAGQINLPVTIGLSYIIPFVYEAMGVTTNYDIIYDPRIRYKFFYILCGISVFGAILNLLPLLFYRLSREKHTVIITSLRYRAVLEDYYLTGNVEPHRIKELVEDVNNINKVREMEMPNLKELKGEWLKCYKMPKDDQSERAEYKLAKAQAKAMPKKSKEEKLARREAIEKCSDLLVTRNIRQDAIKQARLDYEEGERIVNLKDGIAEIWDTELTKFDIEKERVKINCYEKLMSYKPDELKDISEKDFEDCLTANLSVADILSDDARNKSREKALKEYNKFIKKVVKMKENIIKVYGGGSIVIPNDEDVKIVNEMPETTKEELKLKREEIAKIDKINSNYNKAVGLYVSAKEKLIKYESSKLYSEVEKLYEQAVIDAKILDEEEAAEDERIRKEKKDELERLKQEKADKKLAKKNIKDKTDNEGDEE